MNGSLKLHNNKLSCGIATCFTIPSYIVVFDTEDPQYCLVYTCLMDSQLSAIFSGNCEGVALRLGCRRDSLFMYLVHMILDYFDDLDLACTSSSCIFQCQVMEALRRIQMVICEVQSHPLPPSQRVKLLSRACYMPIKLL